MADKIKLPKTFTEEHNSVEYFNRLIGKRVCGNKDGIGTSDKIVEALAVRKANRTAKQPLEIKYKTETAELTLDWIVVVELVEGGSATDVFGFWYRVIEDDDGLPF